MSTLAPVLDTDTETKGKFDKKWLIVFLNDDKTPYEFVMMLIMEVFKKNQEDAYNITKQINDEGSGIVFTGSLELAEMKYQMVNDICKTNIFAKHFKYDLRSDE